MKPSELQEKTCHQFDCAIKTVIRHRAIDFYRAIRRSEKKEMPFAERACGRKVGLCNA